MSISGVKRKKSTGAKPKKRQRVEDEQSTVVEENDLPWREVALPDRLEDAEGFYGLEELDDVEIVKDESGHGVRFRTKISKSERNPPSKSQTPARGSKASTVLEVNEGSEWSGFSDDDTSKIKSTPAKVEEKKKKSDPGAGKSILKRRQADAPLHSGVENAFALLSEDMPDTGVDVSEWYDLKLSSEIMTSISNLGFSKPTSIQKACIPEILANHDVIGKASTGSGKTLAFGIPILHACISSSSSPTALILSPTRELAHQITKHLSALFEWVSNPPRIATVTGGLSIQKQQRQMETANVIVATPGRLWEVMDNSQGVLEKLKKLRILVVDEADRLLSEGHFQEVGQIFEQLEKEVVDEEDEETKPESRPKRNRQILVFSATFHKGLQQKLAGKLKTGEMLTNQQSMEYLIKKLPFRDKPKFIDVNPTSQMAEALKEGVVECGAMEKDLYLYTVLLQNTSKRTLVFTNSISAVKRLASLLKNLALPSYALHSNMEQKQRLRSVERFSASNSSILVATDVAARGLDIKGIELIIHYHVPRTADMYVHRSGRTARAEATGKSILLCSPDEIAGVTRLIAKVHADSGSKGSLIPISLDRQLINRLTPRVKLSQKLTDATIAKEKSNTRDDWLHKAAEDLGVDYDSDDFAAETARNSRGRSGAKARRDNSNNSNNGGGKNAILTKSDIASLRAQLKDLLSKRVNLGFSEKYVAGGALDVDALLREKDRDEGKFLGRVEMLNF